jgi:hypothetical protein
MLDGGAREIDGITGRRYRPRNGVFDMHPADAKALKEIGGATCTTAGVARKGSGFRCVECGFASYFRRCGRCGALAVREHAAATTAGQT